MCFILGSDEVSDVDIQCEDEISSNILFEVYRREIILEFNSLLETVPSDNNEHIVYGKRYDYYEENLFKINLTNKDKVESSTAPASLNLFLCYPSFDKTTGLVGLASGTNTCTTNPWYGLTSGDSWVNIGLEFHLHSVVSDDESDYYDTEMQFVNFADMLAEVSFFQKVQQFGLKKAGYNLPVDMDQIKFLTENYDRAMSVERKRRATQEELDREYEEAYVKTFNF